MRGLAFLHVNVYTIIYRCMDIQYECFFGDHRPLNGLDILIGGRINSRMMSVLIFE